jgi:hypothetical protein
VDEKMCRSKTIEMEEMLAAGQIKVVEEEKE